MYCFLQQRFAIVDLWLCAWWSCTTTLAAFGLGTAAPDPGRHCLVPLELVHPDSGTFVQVNLRDALLAVDFSAQLGNLVLLHKDDDKDLLEFRFFRDILPRVCEPLLVLLSLLLLLHAGGGAPGWQSIADDFSSAGPTPVTCAYPRSATMCDGDCAVRSTDKWRPWAQSNSHG